MPTGKNWMNFAIVNIIFILYIVIMMAISNAQNIQENWPQYRCNPLFMPFASNLEDNFNYCIQNITNSISGDILQPITYTTSSLTNSLGGITSDINGVRGMFNKIRNAVSGIFQAIFGVFLNLIVSFQRIFIGIKDLFGKAAGIVVVLMYMMSGAIMTMNSAWKGPTGQLIRALGKCFHPSTLIKLKSKELISIKDIKLGDVIENGSVVEAILMFDNTRKREKLYNVPNGVNGHSVLVTGSHYLFDIESASYRKVEEVYTDQITKTDCDVLYCLMTDNNIIRIGDNSFWDYNDDCFQEQPIIKYPSIKTFI
jgi:hypothetical protein